MIDPLVITASLPFRVTLVAVVLLSFSLYLKLNDKTKFDGDLLGSRLDDLIPLTPVFSIPYLLYLPYLLWLVFYGILATPYYAEIASSILATQLSAAAVYHFHGTKVLRPPVHGNGLLSRLTAKIYEHDNASCTYPSLHVANAVVCAYWTSVLFPPLAVLAMAFAAAIIASTVFIKQHVVIDVLGGLSLGVLCLMVIR